MSVRLTLLPFGPGQGFCHTLLGPVEPVAALVEAVKSIEETHGRDVPLHFNTYLCEDDDEHGPHYGNMQENADGSRLKHVSVSEILPLYLRLGVPSGVFGSSWNAEAAWSYLACLPNNWRVALYWH
jgi:hypothetical protein